MMRTQDRILDFTKFMVALAHGRGQPAVALAKAVDTWGSSSVPAMMCKAAVSAASLIPSASWGSALFDYSRSAAEFFALVEEQTIIGRMTGIRRMPMAVRTITATEGVVGYWVGNGRAKPVSSGAFSDDVMLPKKVAALCVCSNELLRQSDQPLALEIIQNDMLRAIRDTQDITFINPLVVGDELSPAAITNGAATIESTGDVPEDLRAIVGAFSGDLSQAFFVMHPTTATEVALYRDPNGVYTFPDLGPRGGTLLGIPVLCSRSVPLDSAGGVIALVDASGIALSVGGLTGDISENATIQMETAPSGSSVTPTPTALVSMFQTNSVAIRFEEEMNWRVARTGSVVLLTNVDYHAE